MIISGIMVFLNPVLISLGETETILPYKGFQPFAGYNYGAKQFDRLKQSLQLRLFWSTVFCTAAAIVIVVFSAPIVSLFGTDAEMISLASKALRLNTVLFVTFGFKMVYASFYLAIGKSLAGKYTQLKQTGNILFPFVFLLPCILGLTGVIYVQPTG